MAHGKILNITHHWENANQKYNEVSPHTSQNGRKKKKKNPQTINTREDVKKRETYTAGGNVNWYSHYGEQYEGCL